MGKITYNKDFNSVPKNLGPGPSSLKAGSFENAGFFGLTTQEEFGITMTQVMSDLGITQGTAQYTSEPLLKFVHNGKIKYINKKTIRWGISWDHIASKINVYGGTTMTFGGNSYKVRLMRGWGQVSANSDKTGTPDYENGPLYSAYYQYENDGVNWPTDTSDWNANSPNEWNTLMFPIHVDSQTQSQTGNVPNWASYTNSDLNLSNGYGYGGATWVQETRNTSTSRRFIRGYGFIYETGKINSDFDFNFLSLRLVFELI